MKYNIASVRKVGLTCLFSVTATVMLSLLTPVPYEFDFILLENSEQLKQNPSKHIHGSQRFYGFLDHVVISRSNQYYDRP